MSVTAGYHRVMESLPAPVAAILAALVAGKATGWAYDSLAAPVLRHLVPGQYRGKLDEALDTSFLRRWGPRFIGLGAGIREYAVRTPLHRQPGLLRKLTEAPDDPGYRAPYMRFGEQQKVAYDSLAAPVPVREMIGQVNRDRFLNNFEKLRVDRLLYESDRDRDGLASGADISRTAIRAGLGAAAGYAFGRTMGRLAGIPAGARNRIGLMGGVAGALRNTGVI